MGLIKWEPLNDIETMVDRAMSWPFPRFGTGLAMSELAPRVDISESNGTYLFKADIPGMNKQDVKISLAGDMLTIQGERKRERRSHTSTASNAPTAASAAASPCRMTPIAPTSMPTAKTVS